MCEYGCSIDRFLLQEDRVTVRMDLQFLSWKAHYFTARHAEAARTHLVYALVDSDEPEALELRKDYTPSRMRRFARRFWQWDGLAGLEYYDWVRLDAHWGLQEITAEGDHLPLKVDHLRHVKDVVTPWQLEERHIPRILTPIGMHAFTEWPQLSYDYRWSSLARFYVPRWHGLEELLDRLASR